MSNQRWNNVLYVNIEIQNVEQRRIINVFNVDINNVKKRSNNVIIFNVEFYNVDHRQNNVVNMTICKKLEKAKTNVSSFKTKKRTFKSNALNSKFRLLLENFVVFITHFKENMEKNIFSKLQKFLWYIENAGLQELHLNRLTL